ncbi:PT domain-containing protein [Streptomyces sp. Je 1-79]|uniref:PT domain-containing protein n=1 Tax=Streptomyces sp. Je 1-79 TaxID=2943847 RepID=UPI0021A45F23|nr:PT domain-containing protein [Streptomyces sp. Je 1-79]MCT4356095.1 PT domain-containing protein [Streptomyces sp. Je 1-79]
MRSGPIALRAAGAAAILVLAPTAGTAFAGDGVRATVTPSTARPGADVDVRVQGCKGTTGAATSRAFVADAELTGRGGGDRVLFGDTTVRSGLKSGTYKVSVVCDGREHRDAGVFHVEKHKPEPTHEPTHRPTHEPTHRPTHEPTHRPTHHPSPYAPVRAGGGGAARAVPAEPVAPGVAQTTSENGLGTPYTLVGLGMAAIAAVAVAFRSARRRGAGD